MWSLRLDQLFGPFRVWICSFVERPCPLCTRILNIPVGGMQQIMLLGSDQLSVECIKTSSIS